jgi:hypothetical protein
MGGHIDQRVGARSHSNPNPVKGECLAHSRIRRVRAPMRNVEAFRAQPLCAVIMVKSCLTFLLVCGDSSRPVGVVIIEAPSMPQAQTSAVRGLAAGEAHELSTEMMTSVRPTQIGRIMFAAEAAQMIVRLVQGRVKPEEMTGTVAIHRMTMEIRHVRSPSHGPALHGPSAFRLERPRCAAAA